MSERLIELMATIRAPVRRDWKEMRRAFRVRHLMPLARSSILDSLCSFLGCSLALRISVLNLSRKKSPGREVFARTASIKMWTGAVLFVEL